MLISQDLQKYLEENILPQYTSFQNGHDLEHIKYVINRSLKFAKTIPNINYDMVYTIAVYHDLGYIIDKKTHELISAKILLKDNNLEIFFNKSQIKIMAEAIEDHRASSNHEPRTIYGKIVSSADRNNTVLQCLHRTHAFYKSGNPNASNIESCENSYDVLKRKFGFNGYAKFYFKDEEYENFLSEIRKLLNNKNEFIKQFFKENNLK